MSQLPFLIGISGPARSGKDTAGQYLINMRNFRKISFAEPIKAALRAMLGLTHEHTDGALKDVVLEPYGVTPRRMMQTLGTEWGRGIINADIWLLRAGIVAEEWRAEGVKGVVVTDVRFENEASWVRERGRLIHVRRDARLRDVQIEAHESEAGIAVDESDCLVVNNGSLGDFELSLSRALRQFYGSRVPQT
jgi:hypothetical protein